MARKECVKQSKLAWESKKRMVPRILVGGWVQASSMESKNEIQIGLGRSTNLNIFVRTPGKSKSNPSVVVEMKVSVIALLSMISLLNIWGVIGLSVAQPFGRQDYWESRYESSKEDFSWYSDWADLEPFITDVCHAPSRVLVLGVGTDAALLQGLTSLGHSVSGFDYSKSSISFLEQRSIPNVQLKVADARDLSSAYQDGQFDMIIDKGSLDAVFIADGEDGAASKEQNLIPTLKEAHRVLAKGGLLWSLSGICTDSLISILEKGDGSWDVKVETTEGIFTTSSGYTSNNLDGNLIVCSKR